jgi:uncharacterized protein
MTGVLRCIAWRPSPPADRRAARGLTFPYGGTVRVQEIWRFPVKSMQGERIEAAELEPQGLRDDRAFALFDTETGLGLTARRVPQLLFAAAAYRNDGALTITLPDGTTADDDRALSHWLGRPVTLRAAGLAAAALPRHLEHSLPRLGPGRAAERLPEPGGLRARCRQRSPRRGRRGRAGPLPGWPLTPPGCGRVTMTQRVICCRTYSSAPPRRSTTVGRSTSGCCRGRQSGRIEKDLDVLRAIHRERDSCLAIGATVVTPGRFAVGDEVQRLVVTAAPAPSLRGL